MTDQLGTLLRRLRRQAGLTQEQLAERSGVSVRTIRRLETGKSTDHRLGTVNLLADALDLGQEERRLLAALLAKAQGGATSEAAAPEAVRAAPVPSEADTEADTEPQSDTEGEGDTEGDTDAEPAPPPFTAPAPLPVHGELAEAVEELARRSGAAGGARRSSAGSTTRFRCRSAGSRCRRV